MDEVLFHISQHLEALQVNLNSSIQHGRLMLQTSSDHMRTFFTEVWSGQRAANLREGVERLYLWLADQVEEVKRLAEELIQPRRFLRQIQHLLENDLSRTGLYFGGLGFLFGSLFGVMLGLSWYRPPPPMQRMRAVVCTGYYGPDSLATVEDMPVPTISSPDQILVQVKAASVDTVDSKICYGYGRVLRKQLYKYSYVSIVACLQDKNVTVLIRKQDVEMYFDCTLATKLGVGQNEVLVSEGRLVKGLSLRDQETAKPFNLKLFEWKLRTHLSNEFAKKEELKGGSNKVVDDPEVVMSVAEQGRDELESTGLVFQDDQHNSRTLQSLNMMRKNRHFCDVVLHTQALTPGSPGVIGAIEVAGNTGVKGAIEVTGNTGVIV
uniref:Uncharacterized protein n=1 Tax=Timema bartmani TaxID=61472 RepID=A0A7R9F896_9NEOP|nr:unnamed protein product [Timema bartmani]